MFTRARCAVLAAMFGVCAAPAWAQCTPTDNLFCVTAGSKTGNNPNMGGFPAAWYINAVECPEITLIRGRTYMFKANNVSAIHKFYISTNSTGAGTGVWSEGVNPATGITGNQTMTFAVPLDAPDLLYYECDIHDRMGWKINIFCPADFDKTGFVDTDDFDAFVEAFVSGVDEADFDQSGFVDTDDYDAFVQAFEFGC